MLFLEGFKDAAEKFEDESGLNPPIDLSTMDNRIQIREAIQSGRTQEATLLVNQLHPELLDNDRYLYFHLQVMVLVSYNLAYYLSYLNLYYYYYSIQIILLVLQL